MVKKTKIVLCALALFVASAMLPARPKSRDDAGIQWLETHFHLLDSVSKAIHAFAEPGYQEYKSSALLISVLEENGFRVEKGVAGIPTTFVATYGEGKPVIGILAEYDALPGLSQAAVPYRQPVVEDGYGHGCGHNLLGTGSLAAAIAISKWLEQGHPGTVKLFGCPAEEGGGAKNYMVRDGVFDGLDAAFIWHPDAKNRTNLNSGRDPEDFGNFAEVASEVSPNRPLGSGSDAGSVSFVAPTAKLYVASCTVGSGGHCWQQVAVGGTTIGTKAVVNVGKIYYLTALELFKKPELLKAAREEFLKARGKDFVYESLVGDRKPPLDYRRQ